MTLNLAVQQLSWTQGERRILQDISCDLPTGQFVALVGPNGAGKSSLLRCLTGLITDYGGSLRYAGRDLADMDRIQRARQLTYLEQDAECHWPMTVAHVVALGRLPFRPKGGRISQACRQHIEAALKDTDLTALGSRRVDQLSGGERRRVLLARALATQADILLADEPIAGLDPAHQLRMMRLLKSRAARGMLIVIVLHDLSLAARFCDRVLLLEQGRLVADGPPADIFTPSQLARTYGIEAHVDQLHGIPVILPVEALPGTPTTG